MTHKKKRGVFQEMQIEERFRLACIRSKMETEKVEVHNYFRGYTDAVTYYKRLFIRMERPDAVEFIERYLP